MPQNVSFENEFDLLENELADEAHFHTNGFAQRLVLTRRQKSTRKFVAQIIHTQTTKQKY